MKNRRNYYRILQVQPDAPVEIIHASYRTLMRELKHHPDLGGSNDDAALLNEAYDTLSDPQRRSDYDDKLFHQFIKQDSSRSQSLLVPVFCPVCKKPILRKPERGEVCLTCRTPLQSETEPEVANGNVRTISRTKSSAPIEYYSAWPGKAEKGRMIDFSPKGMRFLCDGKIAAHSVLKISCDLLEAAGVVTNVSEEIDREQKIYAIGVCFLAVRFADPRGTFFSTSA
jgi:hypothetical protein